MLLDLGRVVSLAFSILSLYALLETAFFLPATRWEERLAASVAHIGLAACICLISGILFRYQTHPDVPLRRTLPVRLFLWTFLGAASLFAFAWYLDTYYVPWLWRNQPH